MRARLVSSASVIALVVGLMATVPAAPAGAVALNRPADPVVITGATVPTLQRINPKTLVAFARTATSWRQIPVQVAER
jgi:Flp pilus assembly protein CpaB